MVDGERSRRDELVRAAYEQVAQVGFEGLRLRQIAADVGIDHSTLYHHLPTKHDVIVAVAQHATDHLRLTMPDTPDAAAALAGHLHAVAQLFAEQPALAVVTAELDLRARRDPDVRALMDAHEAGWRAALDAVLERGQRQGRWAGIDRGATVELVIAALKGIRRKPTTAGPTLNQLVDLMESR